MIEGMCQLFWADKDTGRAIQWRAFAWVNNWRLMEEKKGEMIPAKKRNEINFQMKKYEDIFTKPKYKKLNSEGKAIATDPYYENWRCGVSIKSICDDVGASQLYDKLYGPFSDWQHWGAGAFGLMLETSDEKITYRGQPSDSNSSLAVGFQCLIQTLQFSRSPPQAWLKCKNRKGQNGLC